MDRKLTRLFLVRHGETEWNAAQVFQGHLDSPLTPTGLRQANQLASHLAAEAIAAVYSSDLGRSMKTAEPLASRLGLAVISRAELREIDCGDWTGKSYEEVGAGWPQQFETWRSRPHQHRMPGGESVAQIQERSLRFLAEIRARHPGQAICAVTHNTVIRTIICHAQGWPISRLWDGARQSNCAINLLELRDGRIDLLEIASTAHLTTVSTIEFSV